MRGHFKFAKHLLKWSPTIVDFGIMFNDLRIGNKPFVELYQECLTQTNTKVIRWKVVRRAMRAFYLAQYYKYSLTLEGERAECGVLNGFSAYMMTQVQSMQQPDYKGEGLHLVDSFEGLPESSPQDAIAFRGKPADDDKEPIYNNRQGTMAADIEVVRANFKAYPGVSFHKGWIPEVLETLPETKWAFVHIDVDLYAPTKGCLEYFVPRMVPGGVILNDDFGSPAFPGCSLAWQQYCKENGIQFSVLDSGQSVLIIE